MSVILSIGGGDPEYVVLAFQPRQMGKPVGGECSMGRIGIKQRQRFLTPPVIAFIAIAGLLIGSGISLAYGSSSGSWTSLGCPYSGYSAATTSFGISTTYDDAGTSCAQRIVVRYQSKVGGVWGSSQTVDAPASSSTVTFFEFADAQIVYGQHRQKVYGAYRQWETTFTW